MNEYNINQEDLEITIKYTDKDDLVNKLEDIICNLISYSYGSYDVGTDGMVRTLRNDCIYDEDITVNNSTYEKNKDI